MKDIKWSNPQKKAGVRHDSSWNHANAQHPQSNSYADQFLQKHAIEEKQGAKTQGGPPNYTQQYFQSPGPVPPSQSHEATASTLGQQHHHNHFEAPPVYSEAASGYAPPYQGHALPGYPKANGPVSGPQPQYRDSFQYQSGPQLQYQNAPQYQNGPQYPEWPHPFADDGVRRAYTNWHFLDLKNRKQTGDLYKKILNYNKKSGFRTFCFTSSTRGEGVTTILANLVDYIKNQGTDKTFLVIDANFQSPGLERAFGVQRHTYGLIDILQKRLTIQDGITPISQTISVLTTGNTRQYSFGNVEPDDFSGVLEHCKQFADYILIDCPPILSSADALSVAPGSDVAFLVVEAVKVRRQVAEKAIATLQENECELGGAILNRVKQVIPEWVYKFI